MITLFSFLSLYSNNLFIHTNRKCRSFYYHISQSEVLTKAKKILKRRSEKGLYDETNGLPFTLSKLYTIYIPEVF